LHACGGHFACVWRPLCMRVAATLHVCGGYLGSTGMHQKFELKNEDTTEKSEILHYNSIC